MFHSSTTSCSALLFQCAGSPGPIVCTRTSPHVAPHPLHSATIQRNVLPSWMVMLFSPQNGHGLASCIFNLRKPIPYNLARIPISVRSMYVCTLNLVTFSLQIRYSLPQTGDSKIKRLPSRYALGMLFQIFQQCLFLCAHIRKEVFLRLVCLQIHCPKEGRLPNPQTRCLSGRWLDTQETFRSSP